MWKQNLEVLIDEMSNNYEVTGLNILYFCNFPSKALNLVSTLESQSLPPPRHLSVFHENEEITSLTFFISNSFIMYFKFSELMSTTLNVLLIDSKWPTLLEIEWLLPCAVFGRKTWVWIFLRGSENRAGRSMSQFFGYISKLEVGSQLKVAIHNKEVLECIFQRLFQ